MHELFAKPFLKESLVPVPVFRILVFRSFVAIFKCFVVSYDLKFRLKTLNLVAEKETACQRRVLVLCLKLQLWPSTPLSQ